MMTTSLATSLIIRVLWLKAIEFWGIGPEYIIRVSCGGKVDTGHFGLRTPVLKLRVGRTLGLSLTPLFASMSD